jgi:hypothetical protein
VIELALLTMFAFGGLATACMALCAWLSPVALRRAAAVLMARAEALESGRFAYEQGKRHWGAVLCDKSQASPTKD